MRKTKKQKERRKMTKHEFLEALEAAKNEEEFYKVICEVGCEPCAIDCLHINLIDYVLEVRDEIIEDYIKEFPDGDVNSYCLWEYRDEVIKAAHDAIGDKDYRAPYEACTC